MQDWWEGMDVFGIALIRALAGMAGLSLTWLQLKAILIVYLRSFVQAQHLRNLPPNRQRTSAKVCKNSLNCTRATTLTPSGPAAAHRHNPCPSPVFFFPHPAALPPFAPSPAKPASF